MSDAAKLRITLLELDPAPWRDVDVPLSMTFKGLHDTIQGFVKLTGFNTKSQ